ncbi:MAG: hypothetical protein ABJB73_08975 [Candidatus Nitrosocosmicus sp.]
MTNDKIAGKAKDILRLLVVENIKYIATTIQIEHYHSKSGIF